MSSAIASVFLGILGSLATSFFAGMLGWLAASLFAKPLLDFLNLKRQVLEEMVFTANVNNVNTTVYKSAVESLRRLGAKVQATDVTAMLPLRCFLSIRGYNLSVAGSNLIGLSNSLNVSGRHLHADKIEKGLRLPRTSTDEFLDAVKQEIRHPCR